MEEQKREFKGIWIPKEIWLDERLTALDKIILTEIDSLDNEITGCTAGNDYFAKFCQCSETKISSAITKLKKLNYIICTNFDGRQRTLKIINESIKKCKAEYKKVKAINNNINIISQINNDLNFSEKIKNKDNLSKNIIKEKKLTKKQKLELKQQEYNIEIDNYIDQFTQNIEIRKLIKQYIEKRELTEIITTNQVECLLISLAEICGNDEEKQKRQIKRSIMNNYKQLAYPDNFNQKNVKSSYSSIDNTANHATGNPKISDLEFSFMTQSKKIDYLNHMDLADMTKEQREFFDKYCLARDENGDLLKF